MCNIWHVGGTQKLNSIPITRFIAACHKQEGWAGKDLSVLFLFTENNQNMLRCEKFVLSDLPGHCAGEVLGWTDSSMLIVLRGCFWDSKTLWYTVPVKWFTWLWEKQKQEIDPAKYEVAKPNIYIKHEKLYRKVRKGRGRWCKYIMLKCFTLFPILGCCF